MAFLKFIYKSDSTFDPEWIEDPIRRFKLATPAEKCRFCLEQSIILSYFEYIYGKNSTIILKDYRQFFCSWYMSMLQDLAESNNDPYSKNIYVTCAILLGMVPGKIDSDQTIRYLKETNLDVPSTVDKTFYEAYLKFKEKVTDLRQYVENDQMNKARSFTISHQCTIPSFKIVGRFIKVFYEIQFPSYSFSYTNLKDIIEDMFEVDTIFTYLAGYHWDGKNTTGVFGVLASQCLTYDYNDVDLDSPMLGFIDIYSKVVNNTCYLPEYLQALSTAIIAQRRKIVRFLIYLRKHHRIVFEDMDLLADYADSIGSDDNRPLKEYFVSSTGETSFEAYDAFRNSRFAAFEELDKFRTGWRNATGSANSQGTNENGSDDAENPDRDTAPKSENQNTEDELKGLESPTGIQDSSNGDGDQTQNDSDNTTETEPNSDQEAPNEETEEELPPLPRVSDKKGVELKLSERESTDTVLYREELREWIDVLLKNPPKNLSIQTITAIKRVRANWLYLLDVECLYKLLSAIIKMPKQLKVKPPKKE